MQTAQLAIAARQVLFDWAATEGIDFDLERRGILHVYRDRAGFEHAARVTALLRQGGLERRSVTPQEMLAIEPTLHGRFHGGSYTESDASGDIHKFTLGLAEAAARRGVDCRWGQVVHRLTTANTGQHVLRLGLAAEPGAPHDELKADAIVVCAGTASRGMAAALGDRINIYPVKGYSITVALDDAASRAAAPRVSLLDDAAKIVTSRLGDNRLRVAGTAEFNGANRDIRADRIRPLVDWVNRVNRCLPAVSTRQVQPWAGLRPMTPSMLPRVGAGRRPGVFYKTGHGHLGWTLAAATSEQVADSVVQSVRGRAALQARAAAA